MSDSQMKRAVFLDRDGVVNEVVFRNGEVASPRSLEEFTWTEDIQKAINQLKSASFLVFIITNQPDIARKKMDPLFLDQVSKLIHQELPIDEIVVCPHDNQDNCPCRKPKPGMILTLAQKWNIDLSQSFLIGDSWKDMSAGKAANCKTILIQRDYNLETEADFKVKNMASATDLIFFANRLIEW